MIAADAGAGCKSETISTYLKPEAWLGPHSCLQSNAAVLICICVNKISGALLVIICACMLFICYKATAAWISGIVRKILWCPRWCGVRVYYFPPCTLLKAWNTWEQRMKNIKWQNTTTALMNTCSLNKKIRWLFGLPKLDWIKAE